MKSIEPKKNDGGLIVRFLNRIIDAVLGALHLAKYKEQIMYLFVGGGTTVVDWIIFTILVFLLPDLSSNALMEAIRILVTKEEFEKALEEIQTGI